MGGVIDSPPFFALQICKKSKDVLLVKSRVCKVILISIPEVEAGIFSIFHGDNMERSISNVRVMLLEPLDNATDEGMMVFSNWNGHALIFGGENG